MLRLEKLQINGFKSFSDRTEVDFKAGITGVVGPNGCGKSNIGDAINWVLGEQSAKHLRGRSMMDVIFNGSATRKPQGMAEVTLLFEGAEGVPHADGSRLAITRRLFRSGDSEYLLNGKKVRLKDIQELLRESRIGTRTFSKIEQGRIDQVLNAKPRDRRQMIEDAAGISGYKHKRRLTEMKLEATTANLLRVNDVIIEAEPREHAREAGDVVIVIRLERHSAAINADTAILIELEQPNRKQLHHFAGVILIWHASGGRVAFGVLQVSQILAHGG